jgi:hypothetical protein
MLVKYEDDSHRTSWSTDLLYMWEVPGSNLGYLNCGFRGFLQSILENAGIEL